MSSLRLLEIGIPVILSAIVAIVLYVERENRNKKYQARTESNFKELSNKFDIQLYQDGIHLHKEKEKQAIYEKALAAIKASNYATAISLLSDYLTRYMIPDKEKCAVLNLIGNSFLMAGKYDNSLPFFSEMSLIAVRTGDIKAQTFAQNNLGALLDRLEHYEEAIRAFDKAIELNPDVPVAWYNKGVALANLEKHDEALRAFDKAIELKPDYATAWDNKGVALGNVGRYKESLAAHNKAIELKPDYANAWNNKGVALENDGRDEESLAAHNKAIELKPDYANAWNNKGVALQKLGRYEEALTAYNKAIELKPDNKNAWFNKACIYSLMNKKAEALEFLAKAIRLDSKFKEDAKKDDDFKWLWDDPDVKKLVGGGGPDRSDPRPPG